MRLPRALAACALTLAAASLPAPARAENPVLHVRARLRIDLDAVERAPGGLDIRGSLRDDASDEPVGGRTVAVSVEGDQGFFWRYAEPTAPDGSFRWHVRAAARPLSRPSRRRRGRRLRRRRPIDRSIDVARRTPTVTVQAPARIAAHAARMHVMVEAHESDGLGPPRAYDGDAWLTIAGRGRSSLRCRTAAPSRTSSARSGAPASGSTSPPPSPVTTSATPPAARAASF